LVPISPLPPITTIFMVWLLLQRGAQAALRASAASTKPNGS